MIDKGRHSVIGVTVDAVDYEAAVEAVRLASVERRPFTVTALAVHGVMTGVMDEQHKYRLNHFDLVVPDGQPVRWALNTIHRTELQQRVYGPELSLRVLAMAEQEQIPVYFYGSTQPVLDGLRNSLMSRFPNLPIAGMEPSRFRKLDAAECAQIQAAIKASGAAITFVGLGCPRQEVFAYEMAPDLSMPLLAVGAAFDFIAGTLAQAPSRMQGLGMEWIYRLYREPKRLWRRYLYLNPYYLYMLAGQILGYRYSPEGKQPQQIQRYG